jgi:hypothetical protein
MKFEPNCAINFVIKVIDFFQSHFQGLISNQVKYKIDYFNILKILVYIKVIIFQ